MSRTTDKVIQGMALASALTGVATAGYGLIEYANTPQRVNQEFLSVDPDLVVVPD